MIKLVLSGNKMIKGSIKTLGNSFILFSEKCVDCNGSGHSLNDRDCSSCNGKGTI